LEDEMKWIFTALLLSFVPAAALACECQELSAGDAVDRADIVFYGEALENDDGAKFKGIQRYKGRWKKKQKLSEPRNKCDFSNFEPGKKYLVFIEKEKKKTYASTCMGTRELSYEPISPVMLNLAETPQYGVNKKTRYKMQVLRDKMVDQATSILEKVVQRCQPTVWKSKEPGKGHIEVRFDHTEGQLFSAEILRYETSDDSAPEEVRSCLVEQLSERKFPKFQGGPISIQAYLIVDRVDASMVRRKASGSVVKFKSNDRPTDFEVID